jgi:molybdopterin converting factor small subunit
MTGCTALARQCADIDPDTMETANALPPESASPLAHGDRVGIFPAVAGG